MLCDCLLKDIFGGLHSRKREFFQEDVGKAAPMRCSLLLNLVREARSSDLEGWVPWVRRGPRCPDHPLRTVLHPSPSAR